MLPAGSEDHTSISSSPEPVTVKDLTLQPLIDLQHLETLTRPESGKTTRSNIKRLICWSHLYA